MKITMVIPDETVLAAITLATQEESHTVSLGVFPIATAELKDGNTFDYKTSYDERKKEAEKGGE